MARRILSTGALLCIGLLAAPAVLAQSIEIGPGGVRINPGGPPPQSYERPDRRGISQREARRIARDAGLAEIDRVSEGRNRWRFEGVDRRGRDMRVVVDRRNGDLVEVSRF